jgi:hypothetical protein
MQYTAAVSEEVVNDLLMFLFDENVTSFGDQAEEDLGSVSAGYDVQGHFELDKIDFRNDPDRIKVDELDIVWDKFEGWVDLEIDIEEICIGGFCIVPNPFGGCAVRAPSKCFFESDTDIDIHLPLNLAGIIRSEVSALLAPTVNYRDHRGSKNYLEAQVERQRRLEARPSSETGPLDPPEVNSWEVSFYPDTLDIDLFDRADIVGDLLENALSTALNGVLGWLPDWAKDVLRDTFGSLIDLVRSALDLPDDLGEWFSDLIGVSLDLEGFLIEVLDQFFIDYPALRIEDPYPILDWEPPLSEPPGDTRIIPVKLPIDDLTVEVAETELVINANLGS